MTRSIPEMVERVARAICADKNDVPNHWTAYEGAAWAAIEAMREPTEEMVGAHDTYDSRFEGWEDHVREGWSAMIDAALKPPAC